ncbi:MAG: exodeoxyribonuclease VII small subunit [Mariniblastus sp.]|nr:exodeoxyribonuclease VII small subunit [Mariniblastus sp.]
MAKNKKTKPAKPKPAQPSLSFEEALEQLRQTVSQLENGNQTLSESLESYEEGVASLKLCYQTLNDVQQRIEMLVELDEEGNLITRPFDNTASEELARGSRRSTRRSNVSSETLTDPEEAEEDGEDDAEEHEGADDPNSLF